MKYDPILCMMVDDSVKTKDASWKAWSLYIDGKFVKSFNSEMPPIKEAKEYLKENYPGKVAKLSRNTGSSSGYVISSRDSKTIDKAIKTCDASSITYNEIKSVYNLVSDALMYRNDEKKVTELLRKAQSELLTLATKTK